MRTGSLTQCLAVTMAAVLLYSTTLWAAGPELTGSLRTSGVVLTNSIQLPDGGTVRSGDRLSTRSPGLAVIASSSYGRVEVRSGSEARLVGDRVRLEQGAVASARAAIEVDQFTVEPKGSAPGWFAVAKRNGRTVVAAHRGGVLIAAAGEPPVLVPEGSYAVLERENQPSDNDQEKDKEKGKGKKKKGAAAGAAAGGWTIGGLSHAASVALVVGIGAGVAVAAAGLAVALSEEAPSR